MLCWFDSNELFNILVKINLIEYKQSEIHFSGYKLITTFSFQAVFEIIQLFLTIWPFLPTYGLLQDKNIFFFVPELRIKILYSVYCSAKVDLANNKSSPILAKNLFSFIHIFVLPWPNLVRELNIWFWHFALFAQIIFNIKGLHKMSSYDPSDKLCLY